MSDKVKHLADARDKQRGQHLEKCRKLLEDHPDWFEQAIIVIPDEQFALTPEWMGQNEIVGILEAAKIAIVLAPYTEHE